MQKRNVRVFAKKYNRDTCKHDLIFVERAVFHQFGIDYIELSSDTVAQFTSAIIEYQSGKVENIDLDLIEFVND